MAIEIGRYNHLKVTQLTRAGAMLSDGVQEVLLAKARAAASLQPAGSGKPGTPLEIGSVLEVFVLTDSRGTPLATTERPYACVGEVACLTASDLTTHGMFLDWGIDKELFVPFAEQEIPMRTGGKYVVGVRLDDRNQRIIGTSRLNRWFDDDLSGVAVGQAVSILVYRFGDLGAQVVVDHRYSGLVYDSDIHGKLEHGQTLTGYVRAVRADGKLDIGLKPTGDEGRDRDVQILLDALHAAGGHLALHDKSEPQQIARVLNLSKKAFKRAAGNLYRERKLEISDGGIRLIAAANAAQPDSPHSSQPNPALAAQPGSTQTSRPSRAHQAQSDKHPEPPQDPGRRVRRRN